MNQIKRKRKKSLVGWTYSNWLNEFLYQFYNDKRNLELIFPIVYKKKDYETKVRITIEEL